MMMLSESQRKRSRSSGKFREENMSKDDVLRDLYYNIGSEAGYGSVDRLYSVAKKHNISRNEVKEWLRGQLTYTLHHPARRRFPRNPVVASSVGELAQADLVDMTSFSSQNDGYNFLLTMIDVFSKRAFAVPLKSKHASETVKGFTSIFNQYRPFMIQSDRGTEFSNRTVTKFMNEMGVKLYFAYNQDVKASVVERFNRTLRSKMFKYFTAKGNRRYVDVLDQLLASYNNSYHQSIKMRPVEVPYADPTRVFNNLYGFESEREMLMAPPREHVKFKVGDNVRLKYHVEPMEKGYYPNFMDQILTITKVIKRVPRVVYMLQDEQGNTLPRKVYAQDIQLVSKESSFRIEKILKKRKRKGVREVFVKWLNHDPSYNSWIPESNIHDISDG